MTKQSPVSIGFYFVTATCWYKMIQTWQAEFFGIGIYIVLSIFLRQEGSAESKPTDSSNEATGETNK